MKKNNRGTSGTIPLNREAVFILQTALLVCILGHIAHVPLPVMPAALLIMGWSFQINRRELKLPPQAVRLVLALLAVGMVLFTFQSFLGRDPGITALVLLTTLKLLEIRNHRDFSMLVFFCYFLTAANFLFDQGIPILLLSLVQILLINLALLRLYSGRFRLSVPDMVKRSLKLVAWSIPVAAVLFVLFPRNVGPFWNLPSAGDRTGRAGFSSVMDPGRFSRIARSEKPAFRVYFTGSGIPASRNRYFRGLVLWYTDGKIWYAGRFREQSAGKMNEEAAGIRQTIVMEPHGKRWLFALDRPVEVEAKIRVLPGQVILSPLPVKSPKRYRVISSPDNPDAEEIHPAVRRWALQLPPEKEDELQELADQWLDRDADPRKIVETGLNYFRDNGFVYSLDPGAMDPAHPFADFMLRGRKGFCGHYAGAFVYMMRLCGVPARVVAGFQGGTINPVAGHLTVRDADAHAWTEVWIQKRGWIRVDPVAVVAPERLDFGSALNSSLDELAARSRDARSELVNRVLNRSWVERTWRRVANYWEALGVYWNIWIVGYDQTMQRGLFKGLGAGHVRTAGLLVGVVIFIGVIWLLIQLVTGMRSRPADGIARGYEHFLRKLGRYGVDISSWQGPRDIMQKSIKKFPGSEKEISAITEFYIARRYGKSSASRREVRNWQKRIRKLRLSDAWIFRKAVR